MDQFFSELEQLEQKTTNKKKEIKNDEIKWEIKSIGLNSQAEISPQVNSNDSIDVIPSSTSSFPIFQLPDIMDSIRKDYLDFKMTFTSSHEQLLWCRDIDFSSDSMRSLIEVQLSKPNKTIELDVDQNQHQLSMQSFKEIPIDTELTSTNSTSLSRPWNEISGPDQFHRGNAQNFPFLPAGVEQEDHHLFKINQSKQKIDWQSFWQSKNLLTSVPGLNNEIKDFTIQKQQDKKPETSTDTTLNLESLLKLDVEEEEEEEEEEVEEEEEEEEETQDAKEVEQNKEILENIKEQEVIDEIINETASLKIVEDVSVVTSKLDSLSAVEEKKWAHLETKEITTPFLELIANPAIEYPFELDSFQKQAIVHMERGESVFISAHTSAGKTVIAEYAIAMSAKNMTRAIYTSPIKALSNQKFRDFKNTFGDVGLITGDVSVSPASSCLVLTTEILRSMLYKGADLIRDIEWVIFDEVHYLNDLERGVVWEEVIIMLPAHVKIVLLSATVSNPLEFADWIGRTKKMPIYVIGTNKRPVPLEHYIHTPSNDLFKIVDSNRNFLMTGFNQASASFYKQDQQSNNNNRSGNRQGQGGGGSGFNNFGNVAKQGWGKLINLLKEKQQLPVIVFSFSKNKCQEYAYGLGNNINLTTSHGERSQIKVFIEESLARLKGDDRELPQILQIRELLERGIGVHHGGLLPIVKELVEILFSKSLVKVLFATETFAMGVNMPAKTVVYSNTRKHDGSGFRDLLPGEYTQMSGRAGRRGLDKVGTVILTYWKDFPDSGTLESMILGVPSKLNSQFRLTYNMILNLLRVQDFKVEDMIKRSFSEFSTQKDLPSIQQNIDKLKQNYTKQSEIQCILGEPDIENYFNIFYEAKNLNQEIQKTILSLPSSNHFSPGRVLILSNDSDMKYQSYTIGVVIHCDSTIVKQYTNNKVTRTFTIFSLKLKNDIEIQSDGHIIYTSDGSEIKKFCDEKIKIDTKLIESNDNIAINSLEQQLLRLIQQYPLPLGPPALDPIDKLKLKDINFVQKYNRLQKIEKLIPESKCHTCPKLKEHYEITEKKYEIQKEIVEAQHKVSNENLQLMPNFQIRLDILRELGYIDQGNNVLLKGRVSREINTCEELIISELIFENAFLSLEPSEIVAVLSTFIFQEKDATEPSLTPRLIEAKNNLIKTAQRVFQLEDKLGLEVSEDKLNILNFGLMEVCYEWARGMPFNDICQLTNVLEGSIVRAITRIGETCQEVRNCSRIIGDTKLFQKMEEAIRLIKRDIVFASSLYVI
ncbi:DEAD/DEAH box helicase [Tieghemostelium lacteum]|uniref:DEAD/DEAH box helicase n=1 Tax=Tieghemostelium lacteum TaxID=361077 RepID=A0A151Z5X4_TIELA|nr:DEAD/DEAH box helicase [Tieghemostelium lacteum]|eukprot:KYQ89338.1 DEAD/DEAH box helicase [Tieghemostelium lacteum]